MSTLPSNDLGPAPSKQPPSVFTVMLLLAMLFMLIAVIAMYMELNRWAPDFYKTNTARPSVMVAPTIDHHYA